MAGSGLIPDDHQAFDVLLDSLMLQKVMYEIGYELQSRPEWLAIPVRGALDLVMKADSRES